jgi:hypothetical protein
VRIVNGQTQTVEQLLRAENEHAIHPVSYASMRMNMEEGCRSASFHAGSLTARLFVTHGSERTRHGTTQGILSRSPPASACVTPINLGMETGWRSNFRSSLLPESRRTWKLRAQLALTVADHTSLCDCKSLNRYVFRSPSTDQERETPQYPRIHFDEYGGCPRSGAIGSYGPINAPV